MVPCAAGVNVSSPKNNSTVSSPTNFVASATSTAPVTAMAIYVDNNLAKKVAGNSLNTPISMSGGKHAIVVQAWDANGKTLRTPLAITVNGNQQGGKSYDNIDQMTGWANCDSCAGPGGKGKKVPHALTQFRSSPSMDGKSAEFWIGGRNPYSAALWWKQLTPQPSATMLTYDLYFYVNNPNAPQALEFDINQAVKGRKYIFGTECNPRGTHQWDVWNTAAKRWVPSGVGCSPPSAYKWHHVTIEAQRVGAQTKFVSITLDGKKSYLNKYFNTIASGVNELNVAVQLDTNNGSTNYSIWADKLSLQYR